MKKFKVMLSVFMVLLILSVSISPAFAESEYGFESADNQEESSSSEEYEIVTDELSEGPYNNDEKIFCNATIEDDFDDDSLLVVMKNEASLDFENFETPQFSGIKSKKVSELTSYKSEKIHSEFKAKKAEHTSVLKKEIASQNVASRSAVSSVTNNVFSNYDNKNIEEKASAISTAEIEQEYSDFHKIIHIELNTKDKQNVLDTIKELEKNDDVLAVSPNVTCQEPALVANDTDLSEQWALENISAPSAWKITTGSSSVKVGIIDDGIDQSHPDLYDNYDDELSKSFSDAPANKSIDGHGTKVAGVIGAVGNNNEGITGVCWDISLVSLQVYSSSNNEWSLSNTISAIQYADEKNIPIINNSIAIKILDEATVAVLETAINSYDGIFITAAGNYITNIDSKNPSTSFLYPSLINSKKIISVTAIDSNNNLWYNPNTNRGSNIGVTSVDLAAPGDSIKTTLNGDYDNRSGTSYSAPYVAGVAALIKSKHPTISYLGIRKAILDGVDKVSTLNEKVSTGGKLNAYKALNNVGKIKYTIEYDANGGTGTTMADTQITYGFYTNLRDVTYTKPQYDFVGWEVYRASDNKYYYTNGSSKHWYTEGSQPSGYEKVVYANQTPIGHLSVTNNEVITMIAKWASYYYVYFDKNGGGGSLPSMKCYYNTSYTLPVYNNGLAGYQFSKWNVYKYESGLKYWLYSNGGGYNWYSENDNTEDLELVDFENGATFTNLSNIDSDEIYFVAQWDPISYNINYDANGGVGVMDDTIGYTDISAPLRNNTFIKADYIFDGWHIVDSDGYWSSIYDDWDDTITLDKDKKLYNDGDSVVYTADYSGVELTAIAQWLILGDVDGDGEVSVMDATEIQRHFAHIITLTEKQIKCGDFNQDGYFDLADATAIQQYVISGNQ